MTTLAGYPVAPVPAATRPNADLPASSYPNLTRIQSTDLVGPTAANRQPQSIERRLETLRTEVNTLVTIINALSAAAVMKDGTGPTGTPQSLTANLDAGGNKVTNSAAPSAGGDLTNKTYTDAQAVTATAAGIATHVAAADPHPLYMLESATANLQMNGFQILGLDAPVSPNEAATKDYVDGFAGAGLNFPSMTDWVDGGAVEFTATANPTKGTVTRDKMWWRQVGDSMEIRIEFEQTTSGADGTGDYKITIPTGYSIDSSKILSISGATPQHGAEGSCGVVKISQFTTGLVADGTVVPFDGTHVRFLVSDSLNVGYVSSTFYGLGYSTLRVSAIFSVPITGWSNSIAPPSRTTELATGVNYALPASPVDGQEFQFIGQSAAYTAVATITPNALHGIGGRPVGQVMALVGTEIIRLRYRTASLRWDIIYQSMPWQPFTPFFVGRVDAFSRQPTYAGNRSVWRRNGEHLEVFGSFIVPCDAPSVGIVPGNDQYIIQIAGTAGTGPSDSVRLGPASSVPASDLTAITPYPAFTVYLSHGPHLGSTYAHHFNYSSVTGAITLSRNVTGPAVYGLCAHILNGNTWGNYSGGYDIAGVGVVPYGSVIATEFSAKVATAGW